MQRTTHFQLEISGETATLYILSPLDERDVESMLTACRVLPIYVGTLRLDLQALGTATADSLDAVRRILRHWRSTRHGNVRLHTSYLQATCTELPPAAMLSA